MTKVYPPGPFPPHGVEAPGTIDLGIRLRDLFYRRELVVGPVRKALGEHISSISDSPDRVMMSQTTIDAFLDTWPLGHLIDEARGRWVFGVDAEALAVLSRCAQIVSTAVGWPLSVDGRWPMPDEAWIRQTVGSAPDAVVVPRGPRDGAPSAAVALDCPLGNHEPVELAPVFDVLGDEVVARRDEIVAGLASGHAVAVRYEGYVPWDEASQSAVKAFRQASAVQAGFERYGHAALTTGPAPMWNDLMRPVPPGKRGPTPKSRCEPLIVPGLDDGFRVVPIGVLAWDGPHKPMSVSVEAVEILRRLDGQRDAADIAREMKTDEAVMADMLGQLVAVGAASA